MLRGRYFLIGGLCALMLHAWAFSALENALYQSKDMEIAQEEGEGGISVMLAAADVPVQGAEPEAAEPEPPVAEREPEPAPESAPEPDPLPEPTPEPEPEPAPEAESDPEPEPQPESEPEPRPEPAAETVPAAVARAESAEPVESHASESTPARQSDSGGVVADETHYMQTLLNHLNRYKRYPDVARRMRREGVVTVTFTVGETGQVSGVRIAQGSGFAPLDDEVRAMLSRAMPLPEIPAHIDKDALTMTLPVAFSLQR
ncbi:energy transducer TonB [Marinobacter goseongensis]|uniref:energy transducer TonB n=1 Tax=Marinobacter goseongensis TaxID=453838 RepID=UPI0020039C95|nr:energy transducer TonB [Marinobacter goseongensis]MCK7551967.1 energy transducer TonB [Marinobacter goseongensis]